MMETIFAAMTDQRTNRPCFFASGRKFSPPH